MRFLNEGIFPQRPEKEREVAAAQYDIEIIIESFDETKILTTVWPSIVVMLEYRLTCITLVIAVVIGCVLNSIATSGHLAHLSTRFQGGNK